MGYARAAAGTPAADDGRLTVIKVTPLAAAELSAPFAELTFRVHLEGSNAALLDARSDPVTACYRATFGFYGVVAAPRRITCPDDAAPVEIPAVSELPHSVIPDGADRVLRALLHGLPTRPQTARLEADLLAALPVEAPARPPVVDVVVHGCDPDTALAGGGQEPPH
jgi:hypothetical protein